MKRANRLTRRTVVTLSVLAVLHYTTAHAQEWPSRPIRLVVPAAAGGSTDQGGRLVASHLGNTLGQSIVVDNKGGAGGRLGTYEVSKAAADGYTLLYGNSITHALLPAISKSIQYDPHKDFVPVGGIFWYSTLLVCNPSVPYNDLQGFINYARSNPEKINMATAGPGSGNYFSSELLAQMAGIKVTHVPYKGNAPAVQDVMAGMADCIHMGEAKPYVDAGRLRVLATTGKQRDPRFPLVPTFAESGIKDFDATWWQAVYAPAGTPGIVVQKLTKALEVMAADPKVKASMFEAGFVPRFITPSDLTVRMRQDINKFKSIASASNIVLD